MGMSRGGARPGQSTPSPCIWVWARGCEGGGGVAPNPRRHPGCAPPRPGTARPGPLQSHPPQASPHPRPVCAGRARRRPPPQPGVPARGGSGTPPPTRPGGSSVFPWEASLPVSFSPFAPVPRSLTLSPLRIWETEIFIFHPPINLSGKLRLERRRSLSRAGGFALFEQLAERPTRAAAPGGGCGGLTAARTAPPLLGKGLIVVAHLVIP